MIYLIWIPLNGSGIHNKLRVFGNTHQIFMRFYSLGWVIRSIGARTITLIAFITWKASHRTYGLLGVMSIDLARELSVLGSWDCSFSTDSVNTWMARISLCCTLWISCGTVRRIESIVFWGLRLLSIATSYGFSWMSTLHRWWSIDTAKLSYLISPHTILILHSYYRRWLVWSFSTSSSSTWSYRASTNSWWRISRSPIWRRIIVVVKFAALNSRSALTSIIASSGPNSTTRSGVNPKSIAWIVTVAITRRVLAISISSGLRPRRTGAVPTIGWHVSSTSASSWARP